MSTFPFIQVEGSIALPRMRPLDRFAATFGHEWTLTPPHFSLRAEMRALYAAIMRTVCLSADAFREACRWDMPHHFFPKPSAAPVRPNATVKPNPPPALAKTLPRPDSTRSSRARRVPSSSAHRLAGGACAIGGAALLAWIVASHTPRNEHSVATVVDATPIRDAGNSASERLADKRAAHDHATATGTVVNAPRTSQAVDAAQRSAQRAAAAAATASAAAATSAERPAATRPDYVAANPPAAPRGATLSGRADKIRESARGGRTARSENSRHGTRSFAAHRVAPPVTAQGTPSMYSDASSYSPRRHGARQDDDYASIATYANTYTAPRPASRTSVPVDGTEWVNHVSQRRVTEIPDRFAE